MKAKPTEPGRVAVSIQGHDAGRWYAVLSVLDDRYVLLVDGDARKLSNPKKKQVKHLRAMPVTITVAGVGGSGGPIADGDIQKAIRAAKDAYETKTGYAHRGARQEKEKEECALVQE